MVPGGAENQGALGLGSPEPRSRASARPPDPFEQLSAFENLYAAAHEVMRGKRGRAAASAFYHRLEPELFSLQRELRSGEYTPGAYRTFWIHDPKRRLISAAPLRDRVVHYALVRVIEPRFERRFIHHSYACRRGRGTHRCLDQLVRWARRYRYVLKLDVARFFPSIDHQVLEAELGRVIRHPRVQGLIRAIIAGSNPQEPVAAYFPGDDLFSPWTRRRGLPIGNLTSQFFANVLLDRVDHLVKDRLRWPAYLRYADDLCLAGDDRDALKRAREAVEAELLALRLRVHARKSRLYTTREGVPFLGFVIHDGRVRVSGANVRRHRRRLRALQGDYAAGRRTWPEVAACLRAWEAHASQGDTAALRRAIRAATAFSPTGRAGARAPRAPTSGGDRP